MRSGYATNDCMILNSGEIAGFDLYAVRQPDGTLKLNGGRIISKFPEEIEVLGMIYTLEKIDKDGDNEWGIYV